MFTPAMTASSVSAPDLIISIAFLHACNPLALDMTMFLGLCASARGPAAAAAVSAAEPFIQFRLLIGDCIRFLSLFSYTNSYFDARANQARQRNHRCGGTSRR